MFQSSFHIHLCPIRGINTTWCQKCFKVKWIHKFTSIHPTSKERGREIQALQPSRHIYTGDTAVEQYTRSRAAKQSFAEHHTLHYKPCQKDFPKPGPRMNWTKDNKVYERYIRWKSRAEDIFSSILSKESEAEKCAYLCIWMGDDGYPFLKKWKATGKLKFDQKEKYETTREK